MLGPTEGFRRGALIQALADGFRPDPKVSVADWAEAHRVVPGYSARPGPWRNEIVPFAVEIMEVMSPSDPTNRVVLKKSAQIIGTELIQNVVMCAMDTAPGPMMVVQPSIEMAQAFSREKLGPSIEESARIEALVAPEGRGNKGSSLMFKRFPGGFLVITGSNSGKGLRQRSIRYLFKDDLDDFEKTVKGQGDPSKLADQRTKTYPNRKIVEISSPTEAGTSKIEAGWQESDQRRYHVPCPFCGHEQVLVWERVKWEKDPEGRGLPETAKYQCEHCDALIGHNRKRWMLRCGKWCAENPGPNRPAGFHLSDLYSPFCTWADMVSDWLEAKGEPGKLKVFINTRLGEVWIDKADVPDWTRLRERAEAYALGTVPPGVLFLTAGVDTQDDRLEVHVKGWGFKATSWTVDYRVFHFTAAEDGKAVQTDAWAELGRYLEGTWEDWRGEPLRIEWAAVDTGGHRTHQAYEFCRSGPRRMAIRGARSEHAPTLSAGKKVDINVMGKPSGLSVMLFEVGVHRLKRDLFDRLRIERAGDAGAPVYPPGYCHHSRAVGDDWFRQLTNERLVRGNDRRGYETLTWVKTGRNEVLDTEVYAFAAASRYGMERLKERDWERMMADAAVVAARPQGDMDALWGGSVRPAAPAPAKQKRAVPVPRTTGRIG